MSFKKRLLICFMIVALVPTLISSCWLMARNVQAAAEQYREASHQLLKSRQTSLELFTDTVRSNILELLSTPQLISLLGGISSDHSVQNVWSEYDLIETRIRSLQSLGNNMFENIGVYSPAIGQTFACSYHNDWVVPTFYDEAESAGGELIWKVHDNGAGEQDIYLVGAALVPGTGKVVGMVFFQLRNRQLTELIQPSGDSEFGFLLCDGKVVASSGQLVDQESFLKDVSSLSGMENLNITTRQYQGQAYFIGTVTVMESWKYVSAVPTSVLWTQVVQEIQSILYFLLTILAASIVLALALGKSAYRPISDLAKILDRFDGDTLDIHIDRQQDDELNQLAESLNQMVQRIQFLIKKVEEEEEQKFAAEMAALKSQINPHFLYNTLNMIKCLTASGSRENAEQACVCLIRLLRISIGNTKEQITLDEEISYVKNYTKILQFRLDKSFDLEDHVPDQCRNILVPKFTLQPIVENCIVHGFDEETDNNQIVLSARNIGNELEISVTDNGKGIAPEKVQKLENALHSREGLRFSHVGILNVDERIRHLYGEKFGLRIQSFAGDGTRVLILLPDKRETGEISEKVN